MIHCLEPLDPEAIHQFVILKMSTDHKVICGINKTDDEIRDKLGHDVENVLDIDRTWNGNYKFLHCGECGGPIIGHRAEKCRHGERYDPIVVKGFEDKIRMIEGFRKIVKKYIQQEQEEEKGNKNKIIDDNE